MKKNRFIETLNLPKDLAQLSLKELDCVANDIRELLCEIGESCGGHFSSNLGVVELTIALHASFSSPVDKFVWDTSHQCYVHKILTGRLDRMFSIKQKDGLSGFANIFESPHDIFGCGHASTALSSALGLAVARDLNNETHSVGAIIGDASLSGGMSFEALNNIKSVNGNFICILNDNNMSISQPVGSLANYITTLRTAPIYNGLRSQCNELIGHIPKIGVPLKNRLGIVMDTMRHMLVNTQADHLFENFGFRYLGPIDGHNIPMLMAALKYVKQYPKAVLLHIVTSKGKGYSPAEQNPTKFHGVKPKALSLVHTSHSSCQPKPSKLPTYTQVFSETLLELAEKNPKLLAITPAMCEGSGLVEFRKRFASRYFDVGIAEEHAITFAAGLARADFIPIVAIYSTFLQRGFDQVIHDVCIQKLPMIFAIDRAGLTGEDGATHQGVFDLAFLTMIPNMVVLAPKDGNELKEMLCWAVNSKKIVSIRYPKGNIPKQQRLSPFELGKAEILLEPSNKTRIDLAIFCLGSPTWSAYEAAKNYMQHHALANIAVINIKSLKPLDETLILEIASKSERLLCVEDGCKIGGLHARICQLLQTHQHYKPCDGLGVDDYFIEHASRQEQLSEFHLDETGLSQFISSKIEQIELNNTA